MLKRLLVATVLLVGAGAVVPSSAHAQSDILLRLRSGSPLGDRFRVDSAGGVVARSFIGIGIIPQTGQGDRLMWHPFKAAFRVGGVDGTQWDDGSTGFYTFAAGWNPIAQGNYSFAGGYNSQALQPYGVALGFTTTSNGTGAVALGYRSTADANYSVAIGQRASANGFSGAIVMSDASSTDSLEASANNQFSLRAAGGVRLFTNATKTVGVSLNAGGSSWNVISDRDRKENFEKVDLEDMLARIRELPITTWRYVSEEDRTVRHVGPMAQDWQQLFKFSSDDKTINMSDLDGVSLAGVKALEARTAAQAARISALEAELAALREAVKELTLQQKN